MNGVEESGDNDYLEQRAEAELTLAQAATHPSAVKAHYVLASLYLDRIYGPGTPPDQVGASAIQPESDAGSLEA